MLTIHDIPKYIVLKMKTIFGCRGVLIAIGVGLFAMIVFRFFYRTQPEMANKRLRVHQLKGGGRKALILGATGATGRQVLQQLLNSNEWKKVTAITRRRIKADPHGKLNQIIIQDMFSDLKTTARHWKNCDVVFNCLGTTRARAGSAQKFIDIEVGLTKMAAKLASEAGVKHFSVVSAQGANSNMWAVNWLHPLLYIQTLGRKEKVVLDQRFPRTSIFRPGMLNRLTGDRWHENIINWMGLGLRVDILAAAMILDAESTEVSVLNEPAIYYEGNTMIIDQSMLNKSK